MADLAAQERSSEAAPATAEVVDALGVQLGQRGLGLRSLLAVGRTWLERVGAAAQDGRGIHRDGPLLLYEFVSLLAGGLSSYEMQEMVRQRDELQASLGRVTQEREESLRRTLEALSTPMMPVFDGVLVLPLVGAIEKERAVSITEKLLAAVVERRARIIIIDVTGVPSVDSSVAESILRLAQSARLLGSRAILAGIRAELAATLVQIGADFEGVLSRSTLQSAIEWALQERGLAIQPLAPARAVALPKSPSNKVTSNPRSDPTE